MREQPVTFSGEVWGTFGSRNLVSHPVPYNGGLGSGPLQQVRWGDFGKFQGIFFLTMVYTSCTFSSFAVKWSTRLQGCQLRETTRALTKTHVVVVPEARGTWGAGHTACPHVAVRATEPRCPLWGSHICEGPFIMRLQWPTRRSLWNPELRKALEQPARRRDPVFRIFQ